MRLQNPTGSAMCHAVVAIVSVNYLNALRLYLRSRPGALQCDAQTGTLAFLQARIWQIVALVASSANVAVQAGACQRQMVRANALVHVALVDTISRYLLVRAVAAHLIHC